VSLFYSLAADWGLILRPLNSPPGRTASALSCEETGRPSLDTEEALEGWRPAAGSRGEVEELTLELEGPVRKVAEGSWCGRAR
jgi:hypothetical protein